MRMCRNCDHWEATYRWKGNCRKRRWPRERYSEDATACQCPDYEDRREPVMTGGSRHYERHA